MLRHVERQLDHVLRLQAGRKYPEQHVAVHRRCRELDDAGRIDALHDLAGQLGDHFMRLIHQHQRTQLMHHIHKGIQNTPVLPPIKV